MENRFEAVLFDLDGTLADTLADIAAAGNHALVEMGHAAKPVAEYRYLAGQGLEQLIIDALGTSDTDAVAQGMALFRAYYLEHAFDHTRLYDGIADMLDMLTQQKLPMAVLSNKPHDATLEVVRRFCGRWSFDAVLGHRPGHALKPDPAGAVEVANMLSIAPKRWLYLGDTRVDMLTARSAGMSAVGVTWGFRDEPELRESGAQFILQEPMELTQLLPVAAESRARGE